MARSEIAVAEFRGRIGSPTEDTLVARETRNEGRGPERGIFVLCAAGRFCDDLMVGAENEP